MAGTGPIADLQLSGRTPPKRTSNVEDLVSIERACSWPDCGLAGSRSPDAIDILCGLPSANNAKPNNYVFADDPESVVANVDYYGASPDEDRPLHRSRHA